MQRLKKDVPLALTEDSNGISDSHVSNHPLITPPSTLPHRPCDNMSFRQSLSRFRKKAKDKLSKIVDGPERGVNIGEGFYRSGVSSQSEPCIVEGELREDPGISGGKDDPRPGNSLPISRSAVEIGDGQGGSDNKTSGGEIGHKHLHPHSHVRIESESSLEKRDVDGKRASRADLPPQSDIGNESTPTPSISRGGESEST